jgi:NAD(P)H dehydrogenase (quinone)
MEYVCQDCQNGVFSGTNDLVKTLTGQEPLGMMDYILKNEAMFRAPEPVRG